MISGIKSPPTLVLPKSLVVCATIVRGLMIVIVAIRRLIVRGVVSAPVIAGSVIFLVMVQAVPVGVRAMMMTTAVIVVVLAPAPAGNVNRHATVRAVPVGVRVMMMTSANAGRAAFVDALVAITLPVAVIIVYNDALIHAGVQMVFLMDKASPHAATVIANVIPRTATTAARANATVRAAGQDHPATARAVPAAVRAMTTTRTATTAARANATVRAVGQDHPATARAVPVVVRAMMMAATGNFLNCRTLNFLIFLNYPDLNVLNWILSYRR